ncbi:hypothetical protein EW146_g3343 [Bondarzewia mesenterica]|uniref:Uncharacterized protein n=1 Tax=Bondarzewia mesenterica TaxID=1095465 RepID=A0A4S4LXT8_9AGAM|nr:hypothetical protein EW146_g3343 [Bondarzewia mesenterica]
MFNATRHTTLRRLHARAIKHAQATTRIFQRVCLFRRRNASERATSSLVERNNSDLEGDERARSDTACEPHSGLDEPSPFTRGHRRSNATGTMSSSTLVNIALGAAEVPSMLPVQMPTPRDLFAELIAFMETHDWPPRPCSDKGPPPSQGCYRLSVIDEEHDSESEVENVVPDSTQSTNDASRDVEPSTLTGFSTKRSGGMTALISINEEEDVRNEENRQERTTAEEEEEQNGEPTEELAVSNAEEEQTKKNYEGTSDPLRGRAADSTEDCAFTKAEDEQNDENKEAQTIISDDDDSFEGNPEDIFPLLREARRKLSQYAPAAAETHQVPELLAKLANMMDEIIYLRDQLLIEKEKRFAAEAQVPRDGDEEDFYTQLRTHKAEIRKLKVQNAYLESLFQAQNALRTNVHDPACRAGLHTPPPSWPSTPPRESSSAGKFTRGNDCVGFRQPLREQEGEEDTAEETDMDAKSPTAPPPTASHTAPSVSTASTTPPAAGVFLFPALRFRRIVDEEGVEGDGVGEDEVADIVPADRERVKRRRISVPCRDLDRFQMRIHLHVNAYFSPAKSTKSKVY